MVPRRLLALLAASLAVLIAVPVAAGAFETRADVSYDIDSPPRPPSTPAENMLDLYLPEGEGTRPIVVYVHGGGWRVGDKDNGIANKAALFTGAGWVFASINYRLSSAPFDPAAPDPERVMFPDHPHDVGEALAWIDRNAESFGGDPTRVAIIGHSAGAHLVSLVGADRRWVQRYRMNPKRIAGVVSLDTDSFDIAREAAPDSGSRPQRLRLLWNAFGTPEENAATGSWAAGSPLRFADAGDPPFRLITQAGSPQRLQSNAEMARALGQDPERSVTAVALDHAGINRALGAPSDASGVTASAMGFIRAVFGAATPRVRIDRRPPAVVRTRHERARLRIAFHATRRDANLFCRLGRRAWARCASPRVLRLAPGPYRFAVRARAASGRGGPATAIRFTVVRRR